jgi:TonB-dependent receptor-like protein
MFAQPTEQPIDSVSALFTKFIRTNTDNSIVLLTNRNIFLAGEKIWFKAYSVATHNAKLELASKNLFADLVSEKDSVIEQVVMDNSGMRTEGAFNLPASMPTGFYWIRCYTAKQLENKNDVFLHPVYIVNKQLHDEGIYAIKFENNLLNNRSDPSIHFYAERLTAILGVISTGVIEIRDGYNNPLSVTGKLLNSKDSLITSFKTNSLGLARLTFVDDPAEIYTAVFYLNNQAIRYELPGPNKTSIQLSVTNQTAKTIKAIVTLEDSVPAETHTTILAVQRDSLYWAAVGTGTYGITIPIGDFPGGIVRLLLFDGTKNLASERKIFVPKDNVEFEVKADKKKYSEREKVNLHIKLSQPTGEPLVSTLNVAVEDERIQKFSDSLEVNATPPPNEFLFDSWLNRYRTKYSDDDIDLLMITRKSIFWPPSDTSVRENTAYDDNKELLNLTGKIMNRKGNGISNRIVNAMANNSRQFFMDVDTTDHDGRFSLAIPQEFDSLQFSLQITDKHLVQMPSDSVKIDDFHYPGFSTPLSIKQQSLFSSFNVLSLLKKYHVDTTTFFQGIGWLAPVTVKAIKKAEPNYDVSRRLNSISQIVTSDKIRYAVGPEGIMNLLRMVPGVSVYANDLVIFGPSHDFAGHVARPLLVVDGIPMPDRVNALAYLTEAVNPADIDFIEILSGGEAAQFGSRGAGGVISVNTKRGPDKTGYLKTNLRTFTPVTYHVCPKFEMPDYSNKETKNSSTPDPRTAIYWNGNIITDKNGEADISFYTGDNATNYAITTTGLTANGDMIYKRIVIGNKGRKR